MSDKDIIAELEDEVADELDLEEAKKKGPGRPTNADAFDKLWYGDKKDNRGRKRKKPRDEDDLDESKKASMGDPSEVADPVSGGDGKNKASIKMKGKPTAAKLKGVDTKAKMESKFALINNIIAEMQGMDRDEIAAVHANMFEGIESDGEGEEVDYEAEVAGLFEDEELNEDFRNKAGTIFEAAVAAKTNERVEAFITEATAQMEAEREEMLDQLTENLDTYLDYVVGEWMNENELAVEQGIKSEVVESFMGSLKDLFVEHYVDIPEDQVDAVEALGSRVAELEESLNEMTTENVELLEAVKNYEKEAVLVDVGEDLSDTDFEKLRVFAESVEARSARDYRKKLETISEHYFGAEAKKESRQTPGSKILNEDTDPFVAGDVEEKKKSSDPRVKGVVDAISRIV